MSFKSPLLLLALVAIPIVIALYVLAQRRRMRYAVTFTNMDVLAAVAGGGRSLRRYVPPALFLLAVAALCIAVARPQRTTLVPSEQATVILVVDVSGSMRATDVKPTRLGAAQAAVQMFLEKVPKRVRVGLIAFSSDPQVASPPTTDRELLRDAVDSIGYIQGYGGTAIGDALAAAVVLGKQSVPGAKPKPETIAYTVAEKPSPVSILFLSDGKQTRGVLPPLAGAQRAKAAGFPVYTVALGTPNGVLTRDFGGGFFGGGQRRIPVPPDPATLRAIAATTGGKFFTARTSEALQSAYEELGSKLGRAPAKVEVTNRFLAFGALALLAAAGLSLLWSPRLP